MANATLVSLDVEAGRDLLKTLDHALLKMDLALWAVLADYEDPRLILASHLLDQEDTLKAVRAITAALRSSGGAGHRMPRFMVLRMKDPFIHELRRIFSKTSDVSGMRLGGQSFGGRYLEDAYVYRIQ